MKIRRKTCLEKRYTDKMGRLHNNITYIKKTLLNIIPLKIILKYRKTY